MSLETVMHNRFTTQTHSRWTNFKELRTLKMTLPSLIVQKCPKFVRWNWSGDGPFLIWDVNFWHLVQCNSGLRSIFLLTIGFNGQSVQSAVENVTVKALFLHIRICLHILICSPVTCRAQVGRSVPNQRCASATNGLTIIYSWLFIKDVSFKYNAILYQDLKRNNDLIQS